MYPTYTFTPQSTEFYPTCNGVSYAAVRHNTRAPFSIYREGVLIGEARTVEATYALIEQDSAQVLGQMPLF